MRAVTSAPVVAVALGLLIVTTVSGCKADILSSPAAAPAPASSQAAPSAASAASTASPSASASASGSSSVGGVENLAIDPATLAEMAGLFATANGNMPVADVGPAPTDNTYYAYEPATDTYWAKTSFPPASGDPASVMVNFQDGGSNSFFKKVGSGSWQIAGGYGPCASISFFPAAVLAAWSMATTPPAGVTCAPAATTGS